MENTLQKEHGEYSPLDMLSVFFLCIFLLFPSVNFPFSSLIFLIAAVLLRFYAILYTTLDLRFLALGGVILLWVALGLLYTPDFAEGVRFLLRLTLCLLMAYMASRSPAYMRLLLRVFFFAALFVLISVYVEYFLPDVVVPLYEKILRSDAVEKVISSHKGAEGRPTGIYGYTSTTGYILAFLSGIAFIRTISQFRERRTWRGLLYALLFALSLVGIILVSKRSLFLAVLLICGLFLLCHYTRNAGQRLGMILLLVIGVAGLFFYMQSSDVFSAFFDRLTNVEDASYSSGRTDIFERTWNFFLKNPLLGCGSGSFISMYNEAYEHLGGGAHNIYLQLLAENGVPGLLLFVAFFATNMTLAIRTLRGDRENDLLLFSLYGQLVFLLYGFFGNPLYDELLLCVYCLFALLPYMPTGKEKEHA